MGGALATTAAAVEVTAAYAEEVPTGVHMENDHEDDNKEENDDSA